LILDFSYERDASTEQFLFGKGESFRSYAYFGAHIQEEEGQVVTFFRVYAPNAKAVYLVGGFNDWRNDFPMKKMDQTGIWSIRLHGSVEGYSYKYAVVSADGHFTYKSDPYAFFSEYRPHTASVVSNLDHYVWQDGDYIKNRSLKNVHQEPVSVYEVHLGSWQKNSPHAFMSYRELGDRLVPYVVDYGFTHIELLPVLEHPLDASWGYQVTGFFSATSRYGKPEDLMYFIDRCHQAGIGVIMDWVPCHFCKDAHGLAEFDGTNLYESAYKNVANNEQWGTVNFDLTRPEVWSFLISSALFWCDKYHMDGIRVDAVAFMIYLDHGVSVRKLNRYGDNKNVEGIQFVRKLNAVVQQYYQGVLMIAEESTDFPMVTGESHRGGLGFGHKWNMGWMNDTLRYFSYADAGRKKHFSKITFSLMYAFSENFILPFSHDEVVHGKLSLIGRMPGDYWQKFANLRLMLCYMMTHPGKKLLFMGSELGQFIEWDEDRALDWFLLSHKAHADFHHYFKELMWFYRHNNALYCKDQDPSAFEWVECDDSENSVLIFRRLGIKPEDELVIAINLLGGAHEGFRMGVPSLGTYTEVFNTDALAFGGSGVTNTGDFLSEDIPWNRAKQSIRLRVPPYGCTILKKKG
jgi:1,4-alpha-glucan branching enzyme